MYKILCLVALSTGFAFAQEQPDTAPVDEAVVSTDAVPEDESQIYEFVELDPSFSFEGQNLTTWLGHKVATIRSTLPALPEEKVKVKLVIEKDGSVGKHEFMGNVPEQHRQATVSLLSHMPKWRPAKLGGKAVRSYVTIVVSW